MLPMTRRIDELLAEEAMQQALRGAGIGPDDFKARMRQLAGRVQILSGEMIQGYLGSFAKRVDANPRASDPGSPAAAGTVLPKARQPQA